jgi:hypothetical protein
MTESTNPRHFTDEETARFYATYEAGKTPLCLRCHMLVETRSDARVGWNRSRWFHCPQCNRSGMHMVPNSPAK